MAHTARYYMRRFRGVKDLMNKINAEIKNEGSTIETAKMGDQLSSEDLLPYHAPTLKHYGRLAELVQFFPGVGPDGCVQFSDCTHS